MRSISEVQDVLSQYGRLDSLLIGAAITGLFIWWKNRADRINRYRIAVPPLLSKPVSDECHRCSIFDKNDPVVKWDDNIYTIGHLFDRGLRVNPDGQVFGYRVGDGPYNWITYREAEKTIQSFRRGLVKIGLAGGQDKLVGIFAKNSPEWHMSMQGIVGNGSIAVPLYQTLGKKALRYILAETELKTVISENTSIERLLSFVNKEQTHLQTVISIGSVSSSDLNKLNQLGIQCYQWGEVCKLGLQEEKLTHLPTPSEEDVAIICYTSGTTGEPKGAMITHKNVLAAFKAGWRGLWKHQHILTKDDIIVSYLPLAHVYGFISECIVLYVGGSIGYFRGDVTQLLNDIMELKPTIFPAVPRVLNKVYDRVYGQLESKPALLKRLFNHAVSSKVSEVENGIIRKDTIWDRLFFAKIQEKLGGRVKVIMSGSASIQPHVIQWFRAVLGVNIIEGYGQTESTAATSLYLFGDTVPGHVGVPPPEWEIKLVDVPEMGYFVHDDRGEVCVRGPGVFKGYFKQDAKTRQVLKDGWLHSGDIGTWVTGGRLQLIDRKKNIFKLSQGEYIAPEKIELIYERSPYVSQVYVYGESLKSHLIGLVILDEVSLKAECPEQFHRIPVKELHQSPEFEKFILESLRSLGKEDLCGFEQVKKIKLCPESQAFSVENDMLTPTFKKRRHNICKKYKDVLSALYSEAV
ncbi:hypothetical protein ACHWQZ_G016089 [Mnemiopsis leidyi]